MWMGVLMVSSPGIGRRRSERGNGNSQRGELSLQSHQHHPVQCAQATQVPSCVPHAADEPAKMLEIQAPREATDHSFHPPHHILETTLPHATSRGGCRRRNEGGPGNPETSTVYPLVQGGTQTRRFEEQERASPRNPLLMGSRCSLQELDATALQMLSTRCYCQ